MLGEMTTNRLEAFSDGVIAIIITIMVLEFKVPGGQSLADLLPLKAIFISYVLCFAMVGIYWNNHHHLLQTTKFVNGTVMWANLHLLFWLSLVPFCNSWMGQTSFAALPTFVFGLVLFLSAIAFTVLEKMIIRYETECGILAQAIGDGRKEKASLLIYFIALPMAWIYTPISVACYFIVALIWLVPDKRLEALLEQQEREDYARTNTGR
jgi:uncharacterized membrane protein